MELKLNSVYLGKDLLALTKGKSIYVLTSNPNFYVKAHKSELSDTSSFLTSDRWVTYGFSEKDINKVKRVYVKQI